MALFQLAFSRGMGELHVANLANQPFSTMKYILFAVSSLLLVSACSNLRSSSSEKWVDLFNGENLDDFELKNGQHAYRLEDGVIVGTTVAEEPNGFLCTKKQYSNFILEFEVLVDSLLNSGVQFRSHSTAEYRDFRVHGYQVEIDAIPPIQSGAIYDEARRATWLANLDENPEAQAAWRNGDWNHYRVEANGSMLRTWINGVPAVAVEDALDASGFIGLQVHQTDHPVPLNVRWRNLRIMELD